MATPPQPGSRRVRSWGKRTAAVLLVLLVLAAAALAVRWPELRQWAGRYALAEVSKLLVGEFSVERVESLSPWDLRLVGVRIDGPDGEPVVVAERLETALRVRDLVEHYQVTLTRVRLSGVTVSLRHLPDELVIAETFLPVEDEPPVVEDETPPSAVRVSVEDIRVDDLEVVDLPEGYVLGLPETRGRVRYGPRGTRVEIGSARLVARRPGQDVAQGELSGQLALIEGEQSSLSLVLDAGESHLETKASVGYGAEGFGLPSGELELRVHPSLPARAGLGDLPVQLRAPVQAQARLDGERRTAGLDVQTEGGDVSLHAETQGEGYRLELTTARLDLRPTLGAADAPPVLGGELTLDLDPREGEDHYAYDLRLARGRVDALRLPTLVVRGDAEPTLLRVASLRVPKWRRSGDRVQLSGRVTDQGRVRVDLSASLQRPLLAGLVKELAGLDGDSARLEVHGSYDHQSARVDARTHLEVSGLKGHGVGLEAVRADVRAQGSLLQPRLETELHIERLRAPGVRLRALTAKLSGFRDYAGTLAIEGEHASVVGRVNLQLRGDSASMQGRLVARLEDGAQMQLGVGDATYRAGALTLSAVHLRAGGGYLSIDGRVDPDGDNDLSLALSGLDLAQLAQLPVLEDHLEPYQPRGELSGNVRLRGHFMRPSVLAELRGEGMGVKGVDLGSLVAELDYAHAGDQVRLSLRVDPPKLDRLQLTLSGELPPGHRLDASLKRGRYRLEVDALLTDVGAFDSLHPELEKVQGGLDLKGELEGALEEGVEGDLHLIATGAAYDGLGPANLRADLHLEQALSELRASLSDDVGELLSAGARVQTGVVDVVRAGGLPDADWTVDAQVPRRRLDEFPEPLKLDLPVRLAAKLQASGRRLDLTGLSLDADASWAGEPPQGAPAECLGRDRFFALNASFGDGGLQSEGSLSIDGEQVLSLSASGALPDVPLDSLDPRDARVEARIHTDRLDLAGLPWLCGRVRGKLEADVSARGLFAGKPDVRAQVRVDGLGGREAATLDLRMDASANGQGARAQLRALEGTRAVLEASGDLGWSWTGLAAPTGVQEVPKIQVRLDRLPLATIAAPLEQTAKLRGHVSGDLATKRYQNGLALSGRLTLDDVDLALSEPALRLEGIQGTVQVDERHLRFTNLRWGDREGTLRTSGEVRLAGLKPRAAHLRIHAEDLPLRNQGLAFATIDSELEVDADLEPDPIEVQVGIEQLSVELADELNRGSQDLEQHPDVIYVDSLSEEAEDAEPAEAESEQPVLAARIELNTPKPFWVRHKDFAVQIQPKLQISTSEKGVRIAGPVYVRRGYVNLVGRTFNFERGEIRFAGGQEIDPTVDMVAKHFLGGGEYVQVRIGGYLSRPDLEFSTNVAGVGNNETEIMTLLVRGKPGDGSASASAEAAAMLSGLTAGFLSSLTRGKYGEYIPVLALEAGSSTGTRLRAGVQMDDFVPKAWRSVVQGAYVEGYVGSGADDQVGQQSGRGGFLIELYMPHDITTSGAYDEPANWSLDLLWEPLR